MIAKIITARVAPALEMMICVRVLFDATKPIAICGDGLPKTGINTTPN